MTTDSKSQTQTQTTALTLKSDTKPVAVKVVCPSVDEVVISYGSGAVESAMSSTAIITLKEICSRACIKSVTVTSTARTASDQARVMYEALIKPGGVAYSKKLYGANGDKVVAVYEDAISKKLTATATKQAMLDKINAYAAELTPEHAIHNKAKDLPKTKQLLEDFDYYLEKGNYVFTAWYHLKRGSCCQNGCRHCPYGFKKS